MKSLASLVLLFKIKYIMWYYINYYLYIYLYIKNKDIMNMTPIDPANLRTLLNEGTVQFAFKKLNGDLRTAVGTTSIESIPLADHPTGVRESSPSVITYYDLGKNAWRSISISTEIFVSQ